jgi:integrase
VKKNGTMGSPMATYLAEKSTSKAMAAAFKATKIKARTPYEAGRVTYATLVGGSGKVSAFTLQKWMGHADVKTTEGYVKQQDGLSAGELAALGGRQSKVPRHVAGRAYCPRA